MQPVREPRALALYLSLLVIFSALAYYPILKSGHMAAFVPLLMWSPGLAALAASKLSGRSLRLLGWKWGDSQYLFMSFAIPIVYAAAVYAVVWLTGLGGVKHLTFPEVARKFVFQSTFGIAVGSAFALGEEIGWRGFLVPELNSRFSYTKTALLTGCIWAVWHYPLVLFADYNAGTPPWYGVTCFTIMVFALSFIAAWLRLKSGTLWTGVLLHASHNTYIQAFFDPLTTDTGRTRYVIGEFGVGLAITTWICAAYFWSRRGELLQAAVVPGGGTFQRR